MSRLRRFAVLTALPALLLAACSSTEGESGPGSSAPTTGTTEASSRHPGEATPNAGAPGEASPNGGIPGRAGSTELVLLAPVTKDGGTTPGWAKTTLHGESVTCDPSEVYGVTDGIYSCTPHFTGSPACWPTADRKYALCITDAFERRLTVLRATFSGTATKADTPSPIAIELSDGRRCRTAFGGAMPSRPDTPNSVEYSCTEGGSHLLVWGDGTGDGINRDPTGWTVRAGRESGPLTTLGITRAYFAGTGS